MRAWGEREPARAAYAEELARLYGAYRDGLRAIERRDRVLHDQAALDALRLEPARWGATPVFLYGFDDLQPLQRDAIETLAVHAGAPVTVSLAYEPGRAAFAGRGETFQELMALGPEHVELPALAEHYERPALHALERTLFEPPASGRPDPGDALLLLEGGGERAEIELVAAHVARLIGERGFAPEDVAVVLREPREHAALLDAGLRRARGPLRAGAHASPPGTPRSGAASSPCCAARWLGGSADDLLAWLRTPGKLERPGLADRLEQRARVEGAATARAGAGAVGGRPPRLRPARARSRRGGGRRPGRAVPAPGRRVRRAVRRAASRRARAVLAGPEALDARVAGALRSALGELERLAAVDRALVPAPDELARVLHDLEVRAHDDRAPRARGHHQPARAARAARARGLPLRPARGRLPAPGHARAVPGRRRAPRAQRRLRAAPAPARGPPRRRALPALRGRQPPDRAARAQLARGRRRGRAVRALAVRRRRPRQLRPAAPPSAWSAGRWAPPASRPRSRRPRTRRRAHAWRRGRARPSRRWRRCATRACSRVINARATWSASALEAYASCPVKWFVERLLRPAALEPDPEPMLRGDLAHRVLEDTLRALSDGGPLTPERLDEARALLRAALDARADDARISPNAERRRSALRRLEADLLRYVEQAAHGQLGLRAEGVRAALRRARTTRWGRPSWPAASCACRAASTASTSAPTAARRSSTTTRARARRRRPGGSRTPRLQVGLYLLALPQLLDLEAVGGLYQPLGRDDDGRPRGLLLDGADPGLASVGEGPPGARGLRGAPAGGARRGAAGGARHPLGRAGPRPDVVRVPRRLRAPDDLPLRGGVGVTPRLHPRAGARPSPAATATSCCRPTRARARRRCWSSASSPRSCRTACAPTRCWPSPSPRRRRASCARACARACSSSASARRRARPRARGSRPSTASARGSCARTRWPPAWTPAFAVLDPADGRAAQREAFDAALADFLAAPRADALDLAAAYTVDRLQRMVVGAHDALRSRGQTRPTLPPARAADPDAARAALERACAAFAAELAGAGRRRGRRRRARGARGLPRRARRRRDRRIRRARRSGATRAR